MPRLKQQARSARKEEKSPMDHAHPQWPHPANQSPFQLAEIAQLERAGVLEQFRKRSASRREGLAEATGSGVAARRVPRTNKDAASGGKVAAIGRGKLNLQQGTNVVTARGRRRRGRGIISARMVVTGCYPPDKKGIKTEENAFHEKCLNQADGTSGPPYSQLRVPCTVFDKLKLPDTVRKQLSAGTPQETKHIDMLAVSTSKVSELVESQSLLSAGDLSSSMSVPSRQSSLVLTGAEGEVRSELRLSGSADYILSDFVPRTSEIIAITSLSIARVSSTDPSHHRNPIDEMCAEGRAKLQQLCAKTMGMEFNDILGLGGNVAEILLSRLDFVARRPAQVEQSQSLTVVFALTFFMSDSTLSTESAFLQVLVNGVVFGFLLGLEGPVDLVNNPPLPDDFLRMASKMHNLGANVEGSTIPLHLMLDAKLGEFKDFRTMQAWARPGVDKLQAVLSYDDHSFLEPEDVHDFSTTSQTELLIESKMFEAASWEPTLHHYARMIDGEWSKSSPEDDRQHLLKFVEHRVTSPHFEENTPNLTEYTSVVDEWEEEACFELNAIDDFDYQLYDNRLCSEVDTQNNNDDMSVDWEGGSNISRALPEYHAKGWGGSPCFCPPDSKLHDYMFDGPPQDLDFEGATDSISWPL